LAGMLLHMIETARPVNATVDVAARHRSINEMKHAIILAILHIEDVGVAKLSEIVGLAARRWVKQGLIENNAPARAEGHFRGFSDRFAAEHLRREIIQERIVVIESPRRHIQRSLSDDVCGISVTGPSSSQGLGRARVWRARQGKLLTWRFALLLWISTVRCWTAAGICPTPIGARSRKRPGAELKWRW